MFGSGEDDVGFVMRKGGGERGDEEERKGRDSGRANKIKMYPYKEL